MRAAHIGALDTVSLSLMEAYDLTWIGLVCAGGTRLTHTSNIREPGVTYA